MDSKKYRWLFAASCALLLSFTGCDIASLIGKNGEEEVEDLLPPTAGTAVTVNSLTSSSIKVSWGPASDDATAAEDLEYRLLNLAGTDITQIDNADYCAEIVPFTPGMLSYGMTDLPGRKTYNLYVEVKDSKGRTALYSGKEVTSLNPGAFDASFGDDGTAIIDYGAGSNDLRAMGKQSNGKIIVASMYSSNDGQSAVARFNTNGTKLRPFVNTLFTAV